MAYENSAIDTAARFGEIPFAAFTADLIQGTFDALLNAHIVQLQQYQDFVSAMTLSLSDYINNTVDDVQMSDISSFLSNVQMPQTPDTQALVTAILGTAGQFGPAAVLPSSNGTPLTMPPASTPTTPGMDLSSVPKLGAISAIVSALAPSIQSVVSGFIPDKGQLATLQANSALYENYTATISEAMSSALAVNQQQLSISALLYRSIAATVASNKYALLQNMASMGLLRLVVSDGEIETKISFSTWEQHEDGSSSGSRDRTAEGSFNLKRRGIFGLIGGKGSGERKRHVTVSTAKSYHRDTSGSKVDIYGRVLVRFKTDYLPLNGG